MTSPRRPGAVRIPPPTQDYGGKPALVRCRASGTHNGPQPGQGRGVGMLGRAGIADHQTRPVAARAWAWAGPVTFQAVEGQAPFAGPGDHVVLEIRPGKIKHSVQPRGDAADVRSLAVGSSAGQHGGEAIPATAVGQPGPADLPVVATCG